MFRAVFEVQPSLKFEAKLDALLKIFMEDFEQTLPQWSLELWRVDRGQRLAAPPPPIPQGIPENLRLPGQDDTEFGADVTSDRYAPWEVAGCPPKELASDAERTAMRTVDWGGGDGGLITQIAVYPDEALARTAYEEIKAAIDGCPVTERSPARRARQSETRQSATTPGLSTTHPSATSKTQALWNDGP